MASRELSFAELLKIHCISRGIRVSPAAEARLSHNGELPLSIHEYATTGGVTLELEGGIFVNAPFDEWYVTETDISLEVNSQNEQLEVQFQGERIPARALPLPGYLNDYDTQGRPIIDTVMSHADRLRVSPILGCSYNCHFCDFNQRQYTKRPAEQILGAMQWACRDQVLPVRHALISGGTPAIRDYGYLDEVFEGIIRTSPIPVDVMLAPRGDDIVDRLADWGVFGYSINIEVFHPETAARITPQKHRAGNSAYEKAISRAVERVGKNGRVRSLILVGLEPEESILKGVEFLARLGCDPVLSPFRPAPGTPLQNLPPPPIDLLERIYLDARDITERYGVKLGPRCIPCQHNVLTFPDGSSDYYYS